MKGQDLPDLGRKSRTEQAEEWTQTASRAEKGASAEVQRDVESHSGKATAPCTPNNWISERRGDGLVGFTIRVRCRELLLAITVSIKSECYVSNNGYRGSTYEVIRPLDLHSVL